MQRLLDSLETSPALVKTATWEVVAWNRAAAMVLTDYSKLPPGGRNILRLVFLDPRVRSAQHDWQGLARFVVGAFRADAARAGAVSEVAQLVDELCRASPEFHALWRENDVLAHGEGVKRPSSWSIPPSPSTAAPTSAWSSTIRSRAPWPVESAPW